MIKGHFLAHAGLIHIFMPNFEEVHHNFEGLN
jgi:hypothetical protein